MNNTDVVCRCNLVQVKDVQEFYSVCPDMPADQMRYALNIGTRCGCCQREECPYIDIKFQDALKNLKS